MHSLLTAFRRSVPFVLVSFLSAAEPSEPTKSLAPYFFVQGAEPGLDALPLKATSARIEITGVIASVTVQQSYANEGSRPLNLRYVFPASTRAAVHGMRMRIGERTVEAKIAEREAARREFEEAKASGKSASLLEQDRPNVFSMNVANVLPGDRIEVELRYTELLVPTDGIYELVYPTVVGPRYAGASPSPSDSWLKSPYLHEKTSPTYTFGLEARVVSAIPLRDLTVPSHQVDVSWNGPSEARLTLAAREKTGGNRDFILRYRLAGEQIQSGLLAYEGQTEKFFLLMVEPPARVVPAQVPPREYVFILDVSGSMRGFPLDTAKVLMRDLVGSLRPADRFNVLLFSGESELLSPTSLPASAENVDRAFKFIDSQHGGGGTELLPALQRALALPSSDGVSRSFVVVTDGYIAEERGAFGLIRNQLGNANVFAFGIGSSVNHHLIEGVAKAGMGEAFVVTNPSEAPAVAGRFRSYIDSPVLTDVRLELDGFKAYDLEPPSIPDLLASRPLIIHGKWAGKPEGRITVRGVSGAGPFVKTIEVGPRHVKPSNEALSYLWARSRISALSDFAVGEITGDEKNEVVALGLTYNLLTRYTSFIAVHTEVRNTSGATDVDQPLPMPEGVSDFAVGAEPELTWLLALMGVALAVGGVRRARARVPCARG